MKAIINTVLCPIDFSETSWHALEHAAAIARWYQARLVGVHAYSKMLISSHDVVVAGRVPLPTERLTIEQTREEVDAALSRVRTAGLVTDVRVPLGDPAEVIVKTATALPADILVIGTHGLTGFQRLLLGSITEKVLRTVRCPVLSVPPRAEATSRLPFKRIVCAVDFSEPSLAALAFGYSLAQQCDAELTILHVFEPAEEIELQVDRPMSVTEYWLYCEQNAIDRLARLVPDAANDWCTTKTRIERGKPYRKILDVAAEAATDLIVMGVHGRNPLDLMLFGSTTNQVVRRATCPVLTLRS